MCCLIHTTVFGDVKKVEVGLFKFNKYFRDLEYRVPLRWRTRPCMVYPW